VRGSERGGHIRQPQNLVGMTLGRVHDTDALTGGLAGDRSLQ
jgi:hypothetical protein